MFIYRFSRLIQSKLLWGLLALLMVFAFVVADSCSGMGGAGGYQRADETITPKTYEQASRAVGTLTNNDLIGFTPEGQPYPLLPRGSDVLLGALTISEPQGYANGNPNTQRMIWKLIAARQLADRFNLQQGGEDAAKQMIETSYVNAQGSFNPDSYKQFLQRANFQTPAAFESIYADTWLPAQAATAAVFKSVGWISPMERDFMLSILLDETTAYTVTLKNTAKPEDIVLDDAALKAWYDANQERYRRPEERTIAYFEIPTKVFLRSGDPTEEEEIEAMQYHADHMDEFKDHSSTNATESVTYDAVRDQVLAKVRANDALSEARTEANEKILPKIKTSSFEEVAKAYGGVKTSTLTQNGWPVGFQNAMDVRETTFRLELGGEITRDVVAGTDRVYIIQLTGIRESAIRPFEEVKEQVTTACRAEKVREQALAKGNTLRDTLAKSIAEGKSFTDAVAACKDANLTASAALTFTLGDPSTYQQMDTPYSAQVFDEAQKLGTGKISEPTVVGNNDALLVYIASRVEKDTLKKTEQSAILTQQWTMNAAILTTGDWLSWTIETNPPKDPNGIPIKLDMAE